MNNKKCNLSFHSFEQTEKLQKKFFLFQIA